MSPASRLKSSWLRVDSPERNLPSVESLPDAEFVELAYQVILGRKAEPDGLQYHVALLADGKKTRKHFVHELTESAEFKPERNLINIDYFPDATFVDLVYQVLFGRKADPFGLPHHTALLAEGKKSRLELVHEMTQTPDFKAARPDVVALSAEEYVSLTCQVVLGRRGTEAEIACKAGKIRDGIWTRAHHLYILYQSREFKENTWVPMDFWLVLHRARMLVASQLPKAERIVDLGGSSEGNPAGAIVTYGYPYMFKSLSIVELPREQRHELYTEICGEYDQVIETPQGPVNYVYTSMSDLSAFDDGTIDLVYAGQSIEHVTVDEAKVVLREVHRVLKPGGHFCFDTPNGRVTILDPDYHVDDHKHEYTHQEMTDLLEGHGFAVREAKGITLMDRSLREGRFITEEAIERDRLYDDIEDCFLLYYKAQKV